MFTDDINFQQIAPRCGGQREAFEELCCQLAQRRVPQEATFVRIRGSGGDGGVECFADLPDGTRTGWQAKYVFDIESLLKQATESLRTALSIHPTLTKFVLCFPFDLTGPRRGRGLSAQQKYEAWRQQQIISAEKAGHQLDIEIWSASVLRSLLIDVDVSGGLRRFFFDKTILSPTWFTKHLELVKRIAGPRYTPQLHVETPVTKWFAAFGREDRWRNEMNNNLGKVQKKLDELRLAVERTSSDPLWPSWPSHLINDGRSLCANIEELLDNCLRFLNERDIVVHQECVRTLDQLLSDAAVLEESLVREMETRYGPGTAESVGFRQFMAEYHVAFPAANLDRLRECYQVLEDFKTWLISPECFLAFPRAFILGGDWGVGKTHSVCDIAFQRLERGMLSCILFGHQFNGHPDPWTRIAESLGLPLALGRDGMLDALNAAAIASGHPLIVFVDALNETRPLRYWRNVIPAVLSAIESRSHLLVCFTCRSPYLEYCIPDRSDLPVIAHPGFRGTMRTACRSFFGYYGLRPPVAPILQPELSNPLYLRLVCETLSAAGMSQLPTGWNSTRQIIAAFLQTKEKEYAADHNTRISARIVTRSLQYIARSLAEADTASLPWSQATRVIHEVVPWGDPQQVLDWLVGAGLVIEDTPVTSNAVGPEVTIRLAFERLGDFLLAEELLHKARPNILCAFQTGSPLHYLVATEKAVQEHYGVLSALSIIIPEDADDVELPNLVSAGPVRDGLLAVFLSAIPWRDPGTYANATRQLLKEAIERDDLRALALDSLISVCWQPSPIDAAWLHDVLTPIPLARRDAWWCWYLHRSFDASGPAKQLIEAAFELSLEDVDIPSCDRWATALAWFAAAADRRVKDWATRALIRILTTRPKVAAKLVTKFWSVNDDAVRERVFLSVYGALLLRPEPQFVREVTVLVGELYESRRDAFHHALIRDHMRCIAELDATLSATSQRIEPDLFVEPVSRSWQPSFPSESDANRWQRLLRFGPDPFISDFFKYTMSCLDEWTHGFSKENMAKWILQRVARDFGYEGSGCESYDAYVIERYGAGRAKPKWAERIGKKYTWIGMYQLASRLHDHVERRYPDWEPKRLRTPLILLEEREIDPTLLGINLNPQAEAEPWMPWTVDFSAYANLTNSEWVQRSDDLPSTQEFLEPLIYEQRRWRILLAYMTWNERSFEEENNDPYREVWVHIQSYLVRRADSDIAFNALHRRNFFGGWLPEGAAWLHGFAAEYPWGPAFNTLPREWYMRGGSGATAFPVKLAPCWNEIVAEWEYDASMARNLNITVPAAEFFVAGRLWWNGQNGFSDENGRTVFLDPSVSGRGPQALLVDADDLCMRLTDLDATIIWTILGEKWVLGDKPNEWLPRRTFSQVARMHPDGSLEIGDLVFFDDYDADTGPLLRQESYP